VAACVMRTSPPPNMTRTHHAAFSLLPSARACLPGPVVFSARAPRHLCALLPPQLADPERACHASVVPACREAASNAPPAGEVVATWTRGVGGRSGGRRWTRSMDPAVLCVVSTGSATGGCSAGFLCGCFGAWIRLPAGVRARQKRKHASMVRCLHTAHVCSTMHKKAGGNCKKMDG